MQKTIAKENLYKNIINIKIGKTIDLSDIKEKLISLGYVREDIVEGKCEFSIRGGIVDISLNEKIGIRIELWGDEVDSIRYFDITSQRSTEKVDEIDIYPAHEFVLEKSLGSVIENMKSKNSIDLEDVDIIENGNYLSKIDKYFKSFYSKSNTILDYISNDYIVFLDEVSKIKARSENVLKDTNNLIKSLLEKNRTAPESLLILGTYVELMESLKNIQTIYLEKQDIGFID